jgi:DNA-binding transcriptional MerR regulator
MNKLNLEKLSFSIGEVADYLDVNPSVIRFWEKEFKELKPKKNNVGTRRFRKEDLEVLVEIKDLLYEKKFTIKGAQAILSGVSLTNPVVHENIDNSKLISELQVIKEELSRIYDSLS